MEIPGKKIAKIVSILYKIGALLLVFNLVLSPRLFNIIILAVVVIILYLLYLPNSVLLVKNSLFGLIGTVSCMIFLVCVDYIFLLFNKASPMRLISIISDMAFFSGIIAYVLLLFDKKTWFKLAERIAIAFLAILLIADTLAMFIFTMNITVFIIGPVLSYIVPT